MFARAPVPKRPRARSWLSASARKYSSATGRVARSPATSPALVYGAPHALRETRDRLASALGPLAAGIDLEVAPKIGQRRVGRAELLVQRRSLQELVGQIGQEVDQPIEH